MGEHSMWTRLAVRNFKGLPDMDVPLGNPAFFGGGNDSGKTSILQAIVLWYLGLSKWIDKRGETGLHKPGVVLNRRSLIGIPVPSTRHLWRDLELHRSSGGRRERIRIEIEVEGISGGRAWKCGLEFDYAMEDTLYCRPLRLTEGGQERMPVAGVPLCRVAYLHPVSGLMMNEVRLPRGACDVRLSEGRGGDALRTLCYTLFAEMPDGESRWDEVRTRMRELFGMDLGIPLYLPQRGEVNLTYATPGGKRLDIISAGRGALQALSILVFAETYPEGVLLLDGIDAFLEQGIRSTIHDILRQTVSSGRLQVIGCGVAQTGPLYLATTGTVVAGVGISTPLL